MEKEFGNLLRQLRKDVRITLGQLAGFLDISIPYLSDVERGKRGPFAKDRIESIANFLGVDKGQLLAAAARSRGFFELDTNVGPEGQRLGEALMRGWPPPADKAEIIYRILEDEE